MSAEVYDMFSVPDADPNFVYSWKNRADRNMVLVINKGWEIVTGAPELPIAIRQKLAGITGQSSESGGVDEIRTRGDLVLCRMPKDLYETRVAGPVRAKRERHKSSLDTLVDQANDQVRSAMAKSMQKNIRDRQVFQTTDDSKFTESAG